MSFARTRINAQISTKSVAFSKWGQVRTTCIDGLSAVTWTNLAHSCLMCFPNLIKYNIFRLLRKRQNFWYVYAHAEESKYTNNFSNKFKSHSVVGALLQHKWFPVLSLRSHLCIANKRTSAPLLQQFTHANSKSTHLADMYVEFTCLIFTRFLPHKLLYVHLSLSCQLYLEMAYISWEIYVQGIVVDVVDGNESMWMQMSDTFKQKYDCLLC